MRLVSACLLFFAVFLTSLMPIYAHEDFSFPQATDGQINEALAETVPLRFLPSNQLYFLISAKETITRVFQSSSVKRAQFDFVLSGKRLKETYMLVEKGDVKSASNALTRYAKRLNKMNSQLEKARSQNQDVTVIAGEIAEGLKNHEILFYTINKKWALLADGFGFDGNFQKAILGFIDTVMAIDNVMPGVKDRFKTVTSLETGQDQILLSSPTPQILETTPSGRPRRIIY